MTGSPIKQAIKEGDSQEEKRKERRVINVWATDAINTTNPKYNVIENIPKTSQTRQTSMSSQTSHSGEIAPSKNFQKVPNSLAKQAVPDGLFKGKSKQLYDALYSLTRGAIVPTRHVRIRKSKLMKLADIGSRITFESNIRHLEFIGFIKETAIAGSHDGNEFEVFLPEESLSTQTRQTGQTSSTQKVDRLLSIETSQTRQTLLTENKGFREPLKHSSNTNTNTDDEPFGKMNETLSKVFEKVSGKRPQKKDAEKLNEFAELIALELEIAAARTKSISNVPAFLTEHLRRRLIGKSAAIEGKAKTSKPAKAGKQEETVEEYEAEPLTEQGREAVLKTMQEYIVKGQKEFVMSQQDSYTREDWDWLTGKLKQ
jgi:hypothetical protein